jgi:cytochrome c-type biogenesis protein CcmH
MRPQMPAAARLRWSAWVVLAVLLAVALAFGASRPSAPSTPAQRAAAIDAALRCPSCEDISVAGSSAPAAVAIRQVVAKRVNEGQSTARIESFLESRYGLGILLRPPASGLSAVVWVVPLVAVVAGLLGLGALFWRRRRPEPVSVSDVDRLLVEEAMTRSGVEPRS